MQYRIAHAPPVNAEGLINYSPYSVHLQYQQNDHLRHGGQDELSSRLTQPLHLIDKYTVKPVNLALENKDTCIIRTLSYGPKWCFSI